MPSRKLTPADQGIDIPIRKIRGQKVILDSDLARVYGVPTFRFNEAVKRNRNRFPPDFMFQLTVEEHRVLKSQAAMSKTKGTANSSQIAMSLGKHRGRAYRPYAFTEHGAIMVANILRSPRAVPMSVFVVRAFLKMRALLGDKRELAMELAALERELTQRLDVHEAAIVHVLQRVMDLIDPPAPPPEPQKPRIGFTP